MNTVNTERPTCTCSFFSFRNLELLMKQNLAPVEPPEKNQRNMSPRQNESFLTIPRPAPTSNTWKGATNYPNHPKNYQPPPKLNPHYSIHQLSQNDQGHDMHWVISNRFLGAFNLLSSKSLSLCKPSEKTITENTPGEGFSRRLWAFLKGLVRGKSEQPFKNDRLF